ncbi:hypothetical protein [Candidatus Vampirococcus lugosii]|uniref:Uncharacterized protein n=1 Tax=Candidatus Vampirococcus lugosii TaxID=2789015 RepID=A0ABS5QJT8_9BACT|nr:hypothetical protein [Candidatus Vampirococcus lugosii]MBS8121528.1 hypothetical protein [Candidatus Vampirococcus lugosii]
MKINDFFEENKKISPTQEEKFDIYQMFIQKTQKRTILDRVPFYSKVLIYTVFLFFLFLGFYTSNEEKNNKTGIIASTSKGTGDYVSSPVSKKENISYSETEKFINKYYDFRFFEKNKDIVDEQDNLNTDTVLASKGKQLLSEENLGQFKNIVNISFLKEDLDSLVVSYMNGDKDNYHNSYENVLGKINNLYEIFEMEKYSYLLELSSSSNTKSISNLLMITDQLISRLNNDYIITKEESEIFNVFIAWLVILRESDFGKFKGENFTVLEILDQLNVEQFKKNLTLNK